MGVWYKECVRIDGQVMAAVKIQDEWTGQIKLHVREVRLHGNRYYCNVLKEVVDMTEAHAQLMELESRQKKADEWYAKTKF